MARVKGRRQIEKFTEQETGVEIKVYVFTENMVFQAEVLKKTFTGKDGNLVRKQAIDYAQESTELEWTPVIVVKETSPWASMDKVFVGFDLFRYYVTKRQDGKWTKLEWKYYRPDAAVKVDQVVLARDRHFEFGFESLPHVVKRNYRDQTVTVVAYDEATWVGLQQLQDSIRKLRKRLFGLIGSDDGLQKVTDYGAALLKLLPAGDTE